MAQADVDKARAALAETHDVYIPTVTASSGAGGYAYGFPLSPPTVFSFASQSLVFSYSQKDYIRAAEDGLRASGLALKDAREQVAQDAISTYFQLDHAQQAARRHGSRKKSYAARLETIVKTRLDAGQDTPMEYTKARRTTVQIHLQMLQLDDSIATYEEHLGRITGLAGIRIATVPSSIPCRRPPRPPPQLPESFPTPPPSRPPSPPPSRSSSRPSATPATPGGRRSASAPSTPASAPSTTSTSSTTRRSAISKRTPSASACRSPFPCSTPATRPRRAKAWPTPSTPSRRPSSPATRSSRAAIKLEHSTAELAAREELASLDRDMAQEQLDVILVQLKATPSNSTPITPKDEANARIQERQRFIDLLDATFQLRDAQLSLLRQTGQLEAWLQSAAAADGAPPTSDDLIPPKMQISTPTPNPPTQPHQP